MSPHTVDDRNRSRTLAGLLLLIPLLALAAICILWLRNSDARLQTAQLDAESRHEPALHSSRAVPSLELPVEAENSTAHESLDNDNALSPASRSEAQALELVVVDPGGTPVANATLILFDAPQVIASGISDANGRVCFEPREGEFDFALAAPNWYVQRGSIECGAGRRNVALVEAGGIAGRVLVDGALPSEPVQLVLRLSNPALRKLRLPPAVSAQLPAPHRVLGSLRADTDADGRFSFRGLGSGSDWVLGWQGSYFLELKDPHALQSQLSVASPSPDVELRLIRGLEIRLRVVNADGVPIPGARISARSSPAGPEIDFSQFIRESAADAEGRCTLHRISDHAEPLDLVVASAQEEGPKRHVFSFPAQRSGVWDLGDLPISARGPILVRVQDTQRRPIARANIRTTLDWVPTVRWTDAGGLASCKLLEGQQEIGVGASGFEPLLLHVPADATEVLATLQRACVLEFELPGFKGGPDALDVTVSARGPIFPVDEHPLLGALRMPDSGFRGMNLDGTSAVSCAADKHGWSLTGLQPGLELRARLSQAGTEVLWEAPIAPLARGESRRIVIQLPSAAGSLQVRVVSSESQPLPSGMIDLANPRTGSWRAYEVDDQGEVELRPLFGDTLTMVVHAEGHAPRRLRLAPIPAQPLTVVLEPGRHVAVELVGNDGLPYLGEAQLRVNWCGRNFLGVASASAGCFKLEDLPDARVELEARGGFGQRRWMHDTKLEEVRIVVEGHASVRVQVELDEQQRGLRWAIAAAAPGEAVELWRAPVLVNGVDAPRAALEGLMAGEYDIWLLCGGDTLHDEWQRVGKPRQVVLDKEHEIVELELRP